MTKSIFKRALCAALTAVMAVSFTACKKAEAPTASKENIFSSQLIPIQEKYSSISKVAFANEKIYVMGDCYESSGDGESYSEKNQTKLSVLNLDGTTDSTVVLSETDYSKEQSEYRYVSNMVLGNDGNISLLVNVSSYDQTTGVSENRYSIAVYDLKGTLLNEYDITDIGKDSQNENEYFYINNMLMDGDGNYLLSSENTIFAVDNTGKLIFSKKLFETDAGGNSGNYMQGIYKTSDGKIVASVNSYSMKGEEYESKNTIKVFDVAAKDFTAEYEIKGSDFSYNCFDGANGYDLCFLNDTSLCGYDLETAQSTTIIDWLKSGFDSSTMNNATVLPDGRILCTTYDYTSNGGGYSYSDSDILINILTPIDPSTLPDKKVITISAWYLDYNLKSRIAEFNKNSTEYQVEVKTYNSEEDDYTAGVTKLNNDLISGNIPDIIMLNSMMPIDSFISKGILADLNTYLDKDETINKEDYLQNVLEAMSVDGKLYELTPSFSIRSLAGKTSVVGAEQGWTVADMVALKEKYPEASLMGFETSKKDFLSNMLMASLDSYVNFTTGECSFNTDEFKKLLEFSNSFPDEVDYDSLYSDDSYWKEQQTAYRDGKTLLSDVYFYSFTNIRELEQGNFGEPITFIGYPSTKGNGSSISPDMEFSITAKAKNPDGAWEFVKYFISEEYQSTLSGVLPLKISAYDKIMEEAKKKPHYTDENGKEVEYEPTFWLGDGEIEIGVNTDEDNQRIMEFIKSVTTMNRYDYELYEIVSEEVDAYFAGQKSVDEIADIIQNRANIYINESR